MSPDAARPMHSGLVFNIQKYSVHDGPGIRTTVFLKGCPLCCSWCHNPEGITPRRELVVIENRCILCGECRQACPFTASLESAPAALVRPHECTLCEACVDACPTGARQVVGREMTVAEVVRAVEQDRVFYEESGGGVTFSGGEPLLQPEFLAAMLESCRARGIHTAVDTCGFGCTDRLRAMAQRTDLFLYDLKLMDDVRHREHCGVSNRPILENLRALGQWHHNIWLRVPLIPGVTDDDANLEAIGRLAASIPGIRQVNLLPYHRTGLQKLRRLGRAEPPLETESPSRERVESAVKLFRGLNLTAKAGG